MKKIRHTLEQYGGYNERRRQEFYSQASAIGPMPFPGGSDAGDFEAERMRPARPPNVESDVIVPGVWAVAFAACAASLYLFLAWQLAWPWYGCLPTSTIVFALAFALSIGSMRKTLWTMERIIHTDLDQDGQIGPPQITNLELVVQDEKGRVRSRRLGQLGMPDDKQLKFATEVLAGKSLSMGVWAGNGKMFSRPEYETLMSELEAMGIVRRTSDATNATRRLTGEGRQALEELTALLGSAPHAHQPAANTHTRTHTG